MHETYLHRLACMTLGLFGVAQVWGCSSEPPGPGISVTGPATQLVFQVQPVNTFADRPFRQFVAVAALDQAGRTATGFAGIITVTLNPSGSLTGKASLPAVNGLATFPDLRIAQAGTGYTLTASASGLPSVTTAPFDVVIPGPGRIVFQSDRDGNPQIYSMNLDGSGLVSLTSELASAGKPAWSSDGAKIAFGADGGIYAMNSDGSGVIPILTGFGLFGPDAPAWSPDGSKLAASRPGAIRSFPPRIVVANSDGSGYVELTPPGGYPAWGPNGRIAFRCAGANPGICVMNPDGTGLVNLITDAPGSLYTLPAWAPDGTRIAFVRNDAPTDVDGVYVMNADGSGVLELTHDHQASAGRPAWSPDGTKIAFASARDGNWEIYVMNADGSGVTRLTDNPASDEWPSWSP